ncbi:MAG: nucleoside phosphorylase [Acidimicrobiaceae bacterium]|nr:nucleoside phosphorylase [Acidimicrobiaceae bacterium]
MFEDDLDEPGIIEAKLLHDPQPVAPIAVLCFFNDLLRSLVERGLLTRRYTLRSEIGSNHVYEVDIDSRRVCVLHLGVGSPLAVGFTEEAAALGITTFVACGGAGALDARFDLGHVMVVESALRDEGTSSHYARPTRFIRAQRLGAEIAHHVLDDLGIEHFTGRVWTTDAMFRETRSRVQRRIDDGCHMVDMEASALMALAQYRHLRLAHVLYAGDMVAGEEWDSRHWDHAETIRESLFWAAARVALALHDAP